MAIRHPMAAPRAIRLARALVLGPRPQPTSPSPHIRVPRRLARGRPFVYDSDNGGAPTSRGRSLKRDKVEPQREFIEKHGLEARDLDV